MINSELTQISRLLLCKSFQSNIVPIEVGIQGMIHIRNVVLHTEIESTSKYMNWNSDDDTKQ